MTTASARRDRQADQIATVLPEIVAGMRKTDEVLAHLSAQQEKTGAILDHIWSDLKAHGTRLSDVEKTVVSAKVTRWDNIWQAAGVALVIGGFFWTLVTNQISKVEDGLIDRVNISQEHDNQSVRRLQERLDKIQGLR